MKTKITISFLTVLASISFAAGPQYSDWSQPVNLGPVINTGYNDQHPAISKDGLSLYISSDRPGGFGNTYLLPGETPCTCPSLGSELPPLFFFPRIPQLDTVNTRTANTAVT